MSERQLRMIDEAEKSCARLVAIVAELRKKGYEVSGQELKRVPSPHPQDHPRADLLRHKMLIYWRRWGAGRWIANISLNCYDLFVFVRRVPFDAIAGLKQKRISGRDCHKGGEERK